VAAERPIHAEAEMSDTPLTQLTEPELLAQLGKELLGSGVGFGPEDTRRYRRFAEQWIQSRMAEIRGAVCNDDGVRAVFTRDIQERLNDFGIVADALATLQGHPPLTLLALVLLRRGYNVVCGC